MIAHRKSATPQKKKLTAQQQHKGCLKKRVFMFEKSILMEISVERGNEKINDAFWPMRNTFSFPRRNLTWKDLEILPSFYAATIEL